MEYDAPAGAIARSTWTVAPGADPGAIRLRYNRPVELTAAGELQLRFETGVLTESAPIAWQDIDGQRRAVELRVAAGGQAGRAGERGAGRLRLHCRGLVVQLVLPPELRRGKV